MRRTTTLTAVGLLAVTLLTPTTGAHAAGETCRGEAATIVGTGPTLVGTEGRDVIVTGPARTVDALGGDDLICVVPTGFFNYTVEVAAGAGDDVVDTTGASDLSFLTTILGAGSDSFIGGSARDVVYAGARTRLPTSTQDAEQVDTERDVIDTGAGTDHVLSGSPGAVNADVLHLGAGADSARVTVDVASDIVLDGGPDKDTLSVWNGQVDLGLDMANGTFGSSQGTASFTSFESAAVRIGSSRLTYRGTTGDDKLTVWTDGGTPTLDIATGVGQDEITVAPTGGAAGSAVAAAAIAAGSGIDAGDGRDRLIAVNQAGAMSINLKRGDLVVDGLESTVSGIQDAVLMAPEVTMIGDGRDNNLSFVGCNGRLRGGGGQDRLESIRDTFFDMFDYRCVPTVDANGGAGADHVEGGEGNDRLRGGGGNDTIEGGGGNDRIWGGKGHDKVDAGVRGGTDRIWGGKGNDTIYAGKGDDTVRSGPGNDKIKGREGNDRIWGGGGHDKIDGGKGRDIVRGGSGNDVLIGRADADVLLGGRGRDRADGGKGRDRCVAEHKRRCER